MTLTTNSLTISEVREYLGGISIGGVHVDNKRQRIWVTFGKEGDYVEVSIAFDNWVEWIRNKRLSNIGI
jgi:hypothetical protein